MSKTKFGTDQQDINPPTGTAAEVIYRNRDVIITRWIAKVTSSMKEAREAPKPILVNTLPPFLINLVQALSPDDPRQLATEGTSVAQEHGGERARLTNFKPEDILHEYQLLREVVLAVVKTEMEPSEEERNVILSSFDQAVGEAMGAYFLIMTNLRERYTVFMSHEVRKPLAGISGKALFLRRFPENQEQVKRVANEIFEESKKINQMIQDLLDPDTVRNSDKLKLPLERGDLFKIVETSIQTLNRRYGGRFNLEGEKIEGYWNADSIRRAVESLGSNAINYGDKRSVEVKVAAVKGRAIVSVHNWGKYIPSEKHEFIFQSFRRRENKFGDFRGWGHGLPVVRGVAEAHGGSVQVDSSPEKGTTFMIDILIDSRPYQGSPLTPGADDPRDDHIESGQISRNFRGEGNSSEAR